MAEPTPTEITVETCRQKIGEYLAAETAVLKGQSYSIAGRKFTRADLEMIQNGIQFWSNELTKLRTRGSRGGPRIVIGRCA